MFWGIVILLGFGVLGYSLYRLIRSFIKKESKKPVLAMAVGGLVLMGAGGSQVPAEASYLNVGQETYETDQVGKVTIKGETNEGSELTIDDKALDHDGTFTYKVQLTDEGEKELHIKSVHNGQETLKVLTIKPSKEYLAHLETQAEESRLEQAEVALKLAENSPTQAHYDEAFTKIQALSQSYPEMEERLTQVDQHLTTLALVEKLETSLDKGQVATVKEHIEQTILEQDSLKKRLTACEAKIAEKEQVAAALALVEKAEASSAEDDYQTATTALAKLPNKQADLEKRLGTVKDQIETKKQEAAAKKAEEEKVAAEKAAAEKAAAEQAEAERQAQAQAQADAAAQAEQAAPPAAEVGITVLITPTGEKYHRRKCGNGDYSPTTLAQAQSLGLTPCKKCF